MAALETGPKVKVSIRLRGWQIERAKETASERGLRGYQTVLDDIITKGLLPEA
jgi:predicted DNA binding CopG/RHH family protein